MKKRWIILLVIIGILGYQIYESYYHLEVTEYTVETPKINHDLQIVLVGDVHDENCPIQEKMVQKIETLQPDLIVCSGDMFDMESDMGEEMIALLKELHKIAPVYMSYGNHEMMYKKTHLELEDKIKETGVHLLEEEYEDISVKGEMIRIGGLYGYAFDSCEGTINRKDMNASTYDFLKEMCDTSLFKLMLAHRPDSFIFGDADQWELDLVVSGHTHGGQVILPGIGGLYSPEEKWFPKYDYGKYKLKDMTMIITKGVSSSSFHVPRFNNPPEIVRIHIQ